MSKIFVYRTFNLIYFLLRFIFGTVSNKMHQRLGAYLQLQFLLFIMTGDRRPELHQKCCSCDAVYGVFLGQLLSQDHPHFKLSKIPNFLSGKINVS